MYQNISDENNNNKYIKSQAWKNQATVGLNNAAHSTSIY